MNTIHYSLSYYAGEERAVNLSGIYFINHDNIRDFIRVNNLFPEWLQITEWDETDEILSIESAESIY